jgi:hypothetical protein
MANDFDPIPDSLKENANAVVRYENKEFVILSNEKAIYNVKYAITILNKNGDANANLSVYYDNYKKITNIGGAVYDHSGRLVRKLKNKDFEDQSITSSGTLFDDLRLRYINIFKNTYPYTVEYEYTIEYDGFISFPSWILHPEYNVAIQKSKYKITADPNYKFHYKTINYIDNLKERYINKVKEYTWDTLNLGAIKKEPYRSYFTELSPTIYFAPDNFYFDGYYGKQSSWEEYGKWAYQLIKGRDSLSEKTKLELHKLISNETDLILKTKLVYEYMQSKTRYVSIQLGIGGFQPFSALEVDEQGYGDCKALSNYTKALLKEVGIFSIYTEIYGGRLKKQFYKDFPSTNQGNHIILCVPFEKDTIWLECTDQHQAFGYLGSFTDDRYAILIKETGGELVKTKSYSQKENLQLRNIKAKIDESGTALCKVNTSYNAIQFDNISYQLLYGREDQKKNLLKNLKINNFEILDFNYTQQKRILPIGKEELNLKIKNFAGISGNRMFVTMNILNKQSKIPKKVSNRKSKVVLNYEYCDIDSITYTIPENYSFEFIPDSSFISSKFGEYRSSVKIIGKELLYIREFNRNKGWFPPEDYDDLIGFLKKISKADNKKTILIKNN